MSKFIIRVINPGGATVHEWDHVNLKSALKEFQEYTVEQAMAELGLKNLWQGESIDIELACHEDLLGEKFEDPLPLLSIRGFTNLDIKPKGAIK